MISRRNFLKGLLSSVAAGALIKNGILQPEQVIAEPKRRVFDMAANTWRQEEYTTLATSWDGRIAYVAVWDRMLTTKEIASLQNPPSPWQPVWQWHTYRKTVLASTPVFYSTLAGMKREADV